MLYCELYDIKEIEKEWERLKIDKKYHFFDLHDILENDISMYLSVRKDSGKTTNMLILALILRKKYGIVTEYLRNDVSQTTFDSCSKLFDTIKAHGYIEKIFEGKYNDLEYSSRGKEYTLIYRNENGEIERREEDSFLRIKSNEKWSDYKSGYSSPRSWFIIWDEFLDSNQNHTTIVSKLFNNISTFTRDNPRAHVVALSNTVNKYDAIFDDFTITGDIEFMDYGESKRIVTDLGSRYYVELLPVSVEKKKELAKKNVRFYGIGKSKFANFTGVDAWKGYNYKHLLDEDVKSYIILYYVHHRDKWLTISFIEFEDETIKPAFHIAWSNPPKKEDKIVFTLTPHKVNECLIHDISNRFKKAFKEDRVYYATNETGLLFDDFLNENGIRVNRK